MAGAIEDVRFATHDGKTLIGKLHGPGEPRFAVALHGGVGFPARFYQDFAAWLAAEHHAAVLTYDYRDFGWSLDGSLKRSKAKLSDWAITDQSAALNFLRRRFPGWPLRVIGHSLGGQWLAFHDGVAGVDKVAAVGSGPGYWLDHPWPMRAQAAAFWWLIGPPAVRAKGYLPGRALGLGADVPAGVYWEWRKLCLRRDFHRPDWGRAYPWPKLEEARFDLTLVPVSDDVMIAPHMVRKLPFFYPHATVRETLIDRKHLGVGPIGHGGAFLARNKPCWPSIAAAVS